MNTQPTRSTSQEIFAIPDDESREDAAENSADDALSEQDTDIILEISEHTDENDTNFDSMSQVSQDSDKATESTEISHASLATSRSTRAHNKLIRENTKLIKLFQAWSRLSLPGKLFFAVLVTGIVANVAMNDLHEDKPNTYNDLVDWPFDVAQLLGIFTGLLPFASGDVVERWVINLIKRTQRKKHGLQPESDLAYLDLGSDEIGEPNQVILLGFSYIALLSTDDKYGNKTSGFIRNTTLFLLFGCLSFIAITMILNTALLFNHQYFTIPLMLLASAAFPLALFLGLNKLNVPMEGVNAVQLFAAFAAMSLTINFLFEIISAFTKINPNVLAATLPATAASLFALAVGVWANIGSIINWNKDYQRAEKNQPISGSLEHLLWSSSTAKERNSMRLQGERALLLLNTASADAVDFLTRTSST
jgi:hypothetical protein